MVPAEHALEHMLIEKAWNLLASLSSQVDGKQTELQVRTPVDWKMWNIPVLMLCHQCRHSRFHSAAFSISCHRTDS